MNGKTLTWCNKMGQDTRSEPMTMRSQRIDECRKYCGATQTSTRQRPVRQGAYIPTNRCARNLCQASRLFKDRLAQVSSLASSCVSPMRTSVAHFCGIWGQLWTFLTRALITRSSRLLSLKNILAKMGMQYNCRDPARIVISFANSDMATKTLGVH